MKEGRVKILPLGFNELSYEGLRQLLANENFDLIHAAKNKKEIYILLKSKQPQIVIVEADSDGLCDMGVCSFINNNYPNTSIVAFCGSCEEHEVMSILEAGAKGIVFNKSRKEEIIKAIKTVASKKRYYSPHISKKLLDVIVRRLDPKGNIKPKFREREISIIKLICKEHTTKEIADKLSISMRTVEEYRVNILRKIGAKNAVGIALYALRHKLIK